MNVLLLCIIICSTQISGSESKNECESQSEGNK